MTPTNKLRWVYDGPLKQVLQQWFEMAKLEEQFTDTGTRLVRVAVGEWRDVPIEDEK